MGVRHTRYNPREGFYIDPLMLLIRKVFLRPKLCASLVLLLRLTGVLVRGVLMRDPVRQSPICTYLAVCAVIGAVLDLNDYLTRQVHNNWSEDKSWDWSNEIVLITGGSSGIGASVAQTLSLRNPRTRVVIVDCAPLAFVPAKAGCLSFYRCDLSQATDIKSVCARIRKEVGDPTVVFNNAGLTRGKSVMDGRYEDVEVTMKVNLIAPFLILKEFLPTMVKRNHGHVLASSSMSALMPPANLADYGASKAGLAALHEALALELAHKHKAKSVRTSLVTLSFTETPMFKGQTNQSHLFAPLLKVDTVGDAIVDILYSGWGENVYLPGIMRYVSCVRGWPGWLLRMLAEGTENLRVDYVGRQQINRETGELRDP